MFRNESLDATHLAEFHQIEGVVADRDLSLGHLIGILHEFFRKLGKKGFSSNGLFQKQKTVVEEVHFRSKGLVFEM